MVDQVVSERRDFGEGGVAAYIAGVELLPSGLSTGGGLSGVVGQVVTRCGDCHIVSLQLGSIHVEVVASCLGTGGRGGVDQDRHGLASGVSIGGLIADAAGLHNLDGPGFLVQGVPMDLGDDIGVLGQRQTDGLGVSLLGSMIGGAGRRVDGLSRHRTGGGCGHGIHRGLVVLVVIAAVPRAHFVHDGGGEILTPLEGVLTVVSECGNGLVESVLLRGLDIVMPVSFDGTGGIGDHDGHGNALGDAVTRVAVVTSGTYLGGGDGHGVLVEGIPIDVGDVVVVSERLSAHALGVRLLIVEEVGGGCEDGISCLGTGGITSDVDLCTTILMEVASVTRAGDDERCSQVVGTPLPVELVVVSEKRYNDRFRQ